MKFALRPPHPAALEAGELLSQCTVRRTRRSGPGGQHRNKVETAVVLEHRPTGVAAEASERRSQSENQREALRRLRLNLALAVRSQTPADGEPSALWRSRCRNRKISVNPRHEDFPALLAEALNILSACEMNVRSAAARLGCTGTQLVRFLQEEPRALSQLNRAREEAGLGPLK